MNGYALKPELVDKNLVWVKEWIELHTGILFPPQKLPLLQQRLGALCVKEDIKNIGQLVEELKCNKTAGLIRQVIEVATTNHTHFFREMNTITFFIDKILPSFSGAQTVRVWSAAASSGEELYTIIMTMAEKLGLATIKSRYSFLGTDVNPNVIEQAEKGIYSSHRLTEVSADRKKRWFKPIGLDNWAVIDDITELCLFRKLNLMDANWPFANLFHVVFLRNILYYFQKETQEKLLNQIYEVTLPGGWLITSVTESMNQMNIKWERVDAGIYRKKAR